MSGAFARNPSAPVVPPGRPRAGGPTRPVELRPVGEAAWMEGPGVHPSAVVHPSADIDPSASIGPFCVLGPNVRIGAGTALRSHVVVQRDTTIGDENLIHPFASLGMDPQDLKHRGERVTLTVGDRNTIREHVTLHRGTGLGGGETRIGSDCLFMVGAHVAHDCVVGDSVILANNVLLGGHVRVESGAILAGAAAVHHFATIGRLAFVGGLARVTRDVPPFVVAEGSPASPRKVNTVALTRRGWTEAETDAIKWAFRALFRGSGARRGRENGNGRAEGGMQMDESSETATRDASPGSMAGAIARLRAEGPRTAAVLELCEFLERTQAGVHGRWQETLRERSGPQSLAGRA